MNARTNSAVRRILALDPGYDRLGIAVVEGDPSHPILIMSDCIVPKKNEPHQRLAEVFTAVSDAITTYNPHSLAIESLFFSVNKKTAIKVAEARGAILSAAGRASLPVIECSPQQVKIAVTGYGKSNKQDVAAMVPRLLSLPPKKRLDDEYDAIGIGITALAMRTVVS